MKLAAIDIGSNAVRLQVTQVHYFRGQYTFKKLEYLRFPLRLGMDVFLRKEISQENKTKFKELMTAFKILLNLYGVDHYMACATSAMRESENGKEIVKEVRSQLGLKIRIIDGNTEAALINKSLRNHIDHKTYLHIDVGGGSTELNVFKKGGKVATRSFKIGSVRTLDRALPEPILRQIRNFISTHLSLEKTVIGIGTGGNINKIFELAGIQKRAGFLDVQKIRETLLLLESHSSEERINLLHLNEDRADVIIPATKIYLVALDAAKIQKIKVPDLGLKDGMLLDLFEKNRGKETTFSAFK
ncbi:Ppx/GppA phosphatase family protein [Cyclobacterium jeungdonense]|uniref:Phosphatase n=1 Tax=Cyclobacterium jeungdonense TaxID=708087 RepID=A0ABT8C0J4_9BACT|nr:phosphatase [Cyclobacterium jeungdonense]MDN3686320.1 phosphatase [Cyclobacterium jeungdonense]